MHLHPRIQFYHKRFYEMKYSSGKRYNRIVAWLRDQMPCSFSNQITVMKMAGYFHNDAVPERIQQFNESIKLILMVREPVSRSFSAYTFFKEMRTYEKSFSDLVINDEDNEVRGNHSVLTLSMTKK